MCTVHGLGCLCVTLDLTPTLGIVMDAYAGPIWGSDIGQPEAGSNGVSRWLVSNLEAAKACTIRLVPYGAYVGQLAELEFNEIISMVTVVYRWISKGQVMEGQSRTS